MIVITAVCPHCHAPFVSHSSSPLVLSGRGPDPEGVRDAGGPVDPQRGGGGDPEQEQGPVEGAQWRPDPGEKPEE